MRTRCRAVWLSHGRWPATPSRLENQSPTIFRYPTLPTMARSRHLITHAGAIKFSIPKRSPTGTKPHPTPAPTAIHGLFPCNANTEIATAITRRVATVRLMRWGALTLGGRARRPSRVYWQSGPSSHVGVRVRLLTNVLTDSYWKEVAEGQGFEPWIGLHL